MTNIARPEITAGIQERAASVIKQCTKSIGGYLDVYVGFTSAFSTTADPSRSPCTATLWTVHPISYSAQEEQTP